MNMFFPPFLLFVLITASWEMAIPLFSVSEVVLPSPSSIASALYNNFGILIKATAITMTEAILGFIVGSLCAFIMAIAFIFSKKVEYAFYPYAIALKSTPLIALAPILVLWFGNGLLSKVVMSSLVAFFPVLVNSVKGLNSPPDELIDLMKSLSASKMKILLMIRIPYSLSFLFSSFKIASSLAVVGAVIGEFTGATRGIGYLINTSSYYLEMPLMFSGVIMISLGGILFFYSIVLLEKRIIFWGDFTDE